MELISSATATDLIANVSTGVGTTAANLWVVAAVAAAIPLAFYAVRFVISLFPGAKGRRHG